MAKDLRKHPVGDQALRKMLERLRVAFNLEEARSSTRRFIPLAEVERELRRRKTI